MSRKNTVGQRWSLAPLAVMLALLVVAVPASAKAPVFNPYGCPPPARNVPPVQPQTAASCERSEVASDPQGSSGMDAGILAGSVAVLVLVVAGGMLVATHRKDAHGRPAGVPS